MRILGILLLIFSYLFHCILSLFLLGIGLVAWLSRSTTLDIGLLPWSGPTLMNWILAGGALGLLAILLALTGKLRFLLPVWAAVVLVMLVRGVFLSPYGFEGVEHFRTMLAFVAGGLLAFAGSLVLLKRKRRRA